MIVARSLGSDDRADLEIGFSRLALPGAAREYLLEKLPLLHVMLTGLAREHERFLKSLFDRSEAPGREEYPRFVAGDARARPGTALLSGHREQFERVWALALSEGDALRPLADALGRLLEAPRPPAPLVLGERLFRFGERTYVMGVVNVTPDSFSDGGRFLEPARAVAHARALVDAGADILDIGGESTRPGASPVSADEELSRVLPVIRGIREHSDVPVSIDTTKSAVAKEAIAAGASLVNDISGFQFDPMLVQVAAEGGAACAVMHMQGTPKTMQDAPHYEDLMEDVLGSLERALRLAESGGIPRSRVFVDPGIGFGKTAGHNLLLLRRLSELRTLGAPILVGTSRKAFLGALVGGKPPAERVLGTLASISAVAAVGGADVVRVHDVAETREALAVADAIRHAADGGTLYARRG